jgi:acyl-CoA thioester hydrolase
MPRVQLQLPAHFTFQMQLPVRITDLNFGNHLGNDSLLSLLHEARVQFLNSHGYSELDFAGVGLIMADVAIVYKGEGFYGDVLTIKVTAAELHKYGFELYYHVLNQENKEIAQAKTGMLCFNYDARKLARLPEIAAARLETNA